MLLIDQGEKKLIKRDLLDENGDPIPFTSIVDFTLELVRGGRTKYSYSISNGDIVEGDTGVELELNESVTSEWVRGVYDLEATITLRDNRFSGNSSDIQTEQKWGQVLGAGELSTGDNVSIDTGSITFQLIPDVSALVPEKLSISDVTFSGTTASVTFTESSIADSYDVRVNANNVENVGASSPANYTLINQSGNYLFQVRGTNANGDGDWSEVFEASLSIRPQETVTILNVIEEPGTITVFITSTIDTNGYDYRLNSDNNTITDVGNVNSFTIDNLTPVEEDYDLQVRPYNSSGDGDWSSIKVITPPESTSPTISDPSLTVTVTDTTYTVAFTKATDNKADEELLYTLVEGEENELQDVDLIQELPVIASGRDVSELSGVGSADNPKNANVYVKDVAGNVSLYNFKLIVFLDPSIDSISVSPESISGVVGDTGSISWTVNGFETTTEQELATPSSSDETKLVLSNIDKDAATADYEFVGDGSGNINVVSDFDGTTAQIPFSISSLQVVGGTQSETTTFDVISA